MTLDPNLARTLDRLLQIAGDALDDLDLSSGDVAENRGRLVLASNRIERARHRLRDRFPRALDGNTVHDGEHRYVSTYCQHAAALEARRGSDTVSEALHHACRQTCKICQAPCRCSAVGCPCRTARNRSNVDRENPTPRGDPMGPRDRAERDEHGEHEDDQPGQPRPRQDPDAQREHYEREAGEATGEN